MITDIKNKLIPFNSLDEAADFVIDNKGMYISMNLQALVNEEVLELFKSPRVYGYADGVGAQVFLSRKCGLKATKIAGCELWLNILQREQAKELSIAVIGASPEINRETVAKLKIDYPEHNVDFYVDGYSFSEDKVVKEIASGSFDIVFIALGQPAQEILGKKLLEKVPGITVLGLGGSFDVYCGQINRAPDIFIKLHAEWLYRILLEPKRSVKLMTSVSKYLIMMLKS